ncbi:hypothetical protein BDB00DRAFT_940339 [Zychaea mexicana]|uniref:uncharacterized protein n=1 Tax=Zychaea mexicana TaxID=64656 RepID=UPI0022FE0AB1|nr:uncharacterized protein BDB00DRAFT_940339 [Zychaea mexicana]KAI9491426.1 hypothetical protein BDB00DRAFT_940339 [Zychaea mexicana]
MGANISKTTVVDNREQFDRGSFQPQGLYPDSPADYCVKAVKKFIRDGKLAPFYRGLEDPPSFSITTDQDIALAVTCCPRTTYMPPAQPQDPGMQGLVGKLAGARKTIAAHQRKQHQPTDEAPPDSMAYSRVTECPICFLYYPICINYTRCCDKPICTECFLQIKRSVDTPLVPVQCPYCVQTNFGVVHVPPKFSPHYKQFSKRRTDLIQYAYGPDNKIRPRRRNRLGPNDPDVILAGTTRRIIVRPNGEHVPAGRRRTEHYQSPVLNTFFDTQQLEDQTAIYALNSHSTRHNPPPSPPISPVLLHFTFYVILFVIPLYVQPRYTDCSVMLFTVYQQKNKEALVKAGQNM